MSSTEIEELTNFKTHDRILAGLMIVVFGCAGVGALVLIGSF